MVGAGLTPRRSSWSMSTTGPGRGSRSCASLRSLAALVRHGRALLRYPHMQAAAGAVSAGRVFQTLTSDAFALMFAAEPKFVEDCSTKQEKQWVLENYITDLETQGWFLKGPIEAIWGGERDQAACEAASDLVNPGIQTIVETILTRVPPTPKKSYQRRESTLRRAGISSEVISAAGGALGLQSMSIDEGSEQQQVVKQSQKAPHEIAQVQRALDKNSFFSGLDTDQKQELIAGVYLEVHEKGSTLIQQDASAEGDLDKFYIIKNGRCEVFIDGNKVASLGNGHCFGELALLFSSARAATCTAATTTAVWTIRGPVFRKVMQSTALRKREQYSGFLKSVPLLAHLKEYEIGVVADALHEIVLEDGAEAVGKGDIGHSLFIVKEGQIGGQNDKGEDVFWGPGDHFGEASMLLDMPQPMTINALGYASLLEISRRTFKRLVAQASNDSQEVRKILQQNHITLDEETAAKLRAADEAVWADSEDEEEVHQFFPVILDKVEEALDSSCQVRKRPF
jgi:CRP-like cAMP-binding protein